MTDSGSDPRPEDPQAGPAEEQTEREDDWSLDPAAPEAAAAAVEAGDLEALREVIAELHAADVADLLEQLDHDTRDGAVRLLGSDLDPEVLSELEDDVRDDVLAAMDPAHLAAAVRELDPEDVVYLVEDLDEERRAGVLAALAPIDRTAVRQSLQYPEYTAGRMMRRDFVAAPPFWTVGRMIDHMRAARELPEEFHDVVLVDAAMKPVGLVGLSRIMGSGRARTLEELSRERMEVIAAEEPQEDVAYAFNQYHMASAPVVDEAGRLVGVIHMEDAIEALDEEADEDLKRLSGVGDESLSDKVWEITRLRFPWLAVNLVTAILASLVIMQFDATIEKIVALAVLMPIVASMGGNAATQTLAVAVRALATRDLTPANMRRLILRETVVGVSNGLIFAVLVAVVGLIWYGDLMLGAVIGVAMVINLMAAGLAGILVPIALDRMGADPALASGTFVTTVTDVVGFFAFLGLAALILL
ncbi:MAG: magnesium transporter [Pseudomonadota bacterium]